MILPKINKVVIENFSLYKLQRKIEIDVPDGVLCLAGANGLGKSTFISIVSYAMTGVVVPPRVEFKSLGSIPAFVQKSAGFYASYFEGRVEQRDRDLSQVTVEFSLGSNHYSVTRNFFDSSFLPAFVRIDSNGNNTVKVDAPLLEQYTSFFAQDAGLSSFDQYIFIQAYVMTFDENKKLLLWDEDVMNRLMYLFFSVNPESAQRVDLLRKNIKRYESNMRNIQWEISKMEKRLTKLKTSGTVTTEEETHILAACDKEQNLCDSIENIRQKNQTITAEISQINLAIDNIVLKQHSLRDEYQKSVDLLYNGGVSVNTDSKVQEALQRIIFTLFENESANVSELLESLRQEIINAINHKKTYNEEANLKRLKELDQQLQDLKKVEHEQSVALNRKQQEIRDNQDTISRLIEDLEQFRNENDLLLKKRDNLKQSEQIRQEIRALEINIEQRKLDKKENEENRAASVDELAPLEESVRNSFSSVSKRFIPVFRSYAKSFIGLDIDVELKDVNGMASLVINVNGSDRRSRFQLSESQQYFLDIALRFSLIEFSNSLTAFMLIDTPEGSLDIAYESRAGKMFADFVEKGYSVIMTANINSSQLLLKLAEKCGKEKMKVERMTEWTVLTQVQQEEQAVIENAYTQIENNLNHFNA